ncbi:hypothetical protein LA080_004898 [Diaporthe eres]|nr:hypothetical protein LA080_004898 [Diaporthe eres]
MCQETINFDLRLEPARPTHSLQPTRLRRLWPDGCDGRGVFRHSEQRRIPHSPVLIKYQIRYTKVYVPFMEEEAPWVTSGGRVAATLHIAANKGVWTDHSLSVRGRRAVSQIALVAARQALTLAFSMHISNKGLKQI